jgi:hypothetical protein
MKLGMIGPGRSDFADELPSAMRVALGGRVEAP